MVSKYDHLKLKVFESEFKYVLLQSKAELKTFEEIEGNLPFAIFQGDGEVSAIVPAHVSCNATKTEPDWICMRIIGEMPFGSVQGLIAPIVTGKQIGRAHV